MWPPYIILCGLLARADLRFPAVAMLDPFRRVAGFLLHVERAQLVPVRAAGLVRVRFVALVPEGLAVPLVALVLTERDGLAFVENLATRLAVQVDLDLAVLTVDEILGRGALEMIILLLLLLRRRFLCVDEVFELITDLVEFFRDGFPVVRILAGAITRCAGPLQVAARVTPHVILICHHLITGAHAQPVARANRKGLVEGLSFLARVQVPRAIRRHVAREAGRSNAINCLDNPLFSRV